MQVIWVSSQAWFFQGAKDILISNENKHIKKNKNVVMYGLTSESTTKWE